MSNKDLGKKIQALLVFSLAIIFLASAVSAENITQTPDQDVQQLPMSIPTLSTFSAHKDAVPDEAGSFLVYPYYASSINMHSSSFTQISITNTGDKEVIVKLLFVDGSNCLVSDNYLTLSAHQSTFFSASDYVPETSGFLIAYAVNNTIDNKPAKYNHLIGSARVSAVISGVYCDGEYNAYTFKALNYDYPLLSLTFDNDHFEHWPNTLMAPGILPLLSEEYLQFVILVTPSFDMLQNNLVMLVYDDAEQVYSAMSTFTCQLVKVINDDFPRTAPRFDTVIPAGRSGWMRLIKVNDNGAAPMLGLLMTCGQTTLGGIEQIHGACFSNGCQNATLSGGFQ